MRGFVALGNEGRTLFDAEPVLLVHNDQPEVEELDLLLEEGMCPDDDSRIARRCGKQRLASLARPLRAGEQCDLSASVGSTEHSALRERSEHGRDRPMVLLSQNLCRC